MGRVVVAALAGARAAVTPVAAASWNEVVEGRRLTIETEGAPLAAVLEALAERGRVTVIGSPSPAARVTLSFKRLGVEEGLRRLLEGVPHIASYAASEGGQATLVELRLLGA